MLTWARSQLPRRSIAWCIFVGVLSAHAPVSVLAQEPVWYQIELVVFAHRDSTGAASEVWSTDPGTPSLESTVELATTDMSPADTEAPTPLTQNPSAADPQGEPPADPLGEGGDTAVEVSVPAEPTENAQTLDAIASLGLRAFVRLPQEELQLTSLRQRLDKSPGYETLVHVGWRQALSRNEKPQAVHIYRGMEQADTQTSLAEPLVDPLVSADTARIDQAVASPLPLDGTVAVVLGRYLHVAADLVYAPEEAPLPAAAPGTASPPPQVPAPTDIPTEEGTIDGALADGEQPVVPKPLVYRMTQSRRMRSNELHYLDHPLFGMLIQATPVKLGNL